MSTITIRPFAAAKLLTFAALCLGGCHLSGIRGNGHIVTENRPVQDFTSVEAEGAFDIDWVPGAASCTIRTDENLLRHVETSMNGKKLRLEWHGQLRPTHGMKVKLSSSALSGARLTGAVRLTGTRLSGKGFYLEGTGATRDVRREQTRRGIAPGENGGALHLRRGESGSSPERSPESGDLRRRQGDLYRQSDRGKTDQRRGHDPET
jgi:hypothetical protein